MTRLVSILLIAAAAPLMAGVMYFTVPMLRSADAAVSIGVDEHVERARRLLLEYGESEERLAQLLSQLGAQGVSIGLGGDDAERVLDENRDVVESADERLAEIGRGPTASRARELDARYQSAGGDDPNPLAPPGRIGGSASAILRSAREGISAREKILSENKRILNKALQEVDAALAVTIGEASGSQNQFAQRMKGIILLGEAKALQREAQLVRLTVDVPREMLTEMVRQATALAVDSQIVERSEIREQLDALEDDARMIETDLTRRSTDVERLDAHIAELERSIAAAREKSDAARRAMETLEEEGADLLDPQGAQSFDERYNALSETFREALAEAHRIEYGTLEGARIDDSGDYLYGSFVPDRPGGTIAERRGLVDFVHDRDQAVVDRDGLAATLQDSGTSIEELTALLERYDQDAASAAETLDALATAAIAGFEEFERVVGEADTLWQRAEGKARGAMQAFRAAGNAANTRTREAQSRLDMLSPTSQDRSAYKSLSQDRWLAGQLSNATAQANYLSGAIAAGQYEAAAADLALVSVVQRHLAIDAADPSSYEQKRDVAGQEAIDRLRTAVGDFERSHGELGSNWTIPAQLGAAHYVLSRVENPAHLQTAIQNYQNAVDNSSPGPHTSLIADRLEQLRNR